MINIVEGHQFTSSVGYKPGPGRRQYDRITNAACECGVEYEWEGRETQHDRHVLDIIRADERAKIAAAIREERDGVAHARRIQVAIGAEPVSYLLTSAEWGIYGHAAEIAERAS